MGRHILLLAAVALSGSCGSSGHGVNIVLSADGKLDHMRILLFDADTKQQELDTQWFPVTRPTLRIGIKLPKESNHDLFIFGAEGDSVTDSHGDSVPSPGSELFFASRFRSAGVVQLSARMVHVPVADEGDRDLWPSLAFPSDLGGDTQAFYADKMALLDCDDTQYTAHPYATEDCKTPVDEDCDGKTPTCFDTDGDGDPDDTDCDKMNPAIHHPTLADPFPESANCCGRNLGKTGTEASMPYGEPLCHSGTCGDGIDQDCSGTDTVCERDNDCDGMLASNVMTGVPCSSPANNPPGTDCNDCDPHIYPGAPELCDGIDNNCNGVTDETCTGCDLDGDGFQRMDPANHCPDSAYVMSGKPVDCDDDDAGVFPGLTSAMFPLKAPLASQNCKGKEGGSIACALRQACQRRGADGNLQDVDCNGTPAQGCPAASCDVDGDGFIDNAKKATCDPGGTLGPYDCNDGDPHSFPGAPDKCGDSIPQNCATDLPCGVDQDMDGYDTSTDCDDSDPLVHPWATEVCDGKDNDCDGLVDEGNPDATGIPMYDNVAKTVLRCDDSNVGECGKKVNNALTGRCVCSAKMLQGQFFTQSNRVACPMETQQVDDGSLSAARCYGAFQPAMETCNGLDDDCNTASADGAGECGVGVNLSLPYCCVMDSACKASQAQCP